ncbi:MAG: AAA family ATPase [Eggerthellaceae bacterium]
MNDLDIDLGQRITVIAGQNGTSKSTLLGMLGQPFGLRDARTIFDKTFSAKFTDIFNMSPNHDIPGEHLYFVDFNDESIPGSQGQHIQVKSFKRPPTDKCHIRIVTGSSRGKGEGNIDYPVVYLGLKRTYPVGEFLNPKATETDFTDKELELFTTWYSRIMIAGDSVNPVRMSRKGQKETLLVNSDEYDYLANSAGQDNLGQILGALISFRRLKDDLGDAYKGGLLLIDEFDATLFPSSQNSLLDLVYEVAPNLKLQVIFTTHSLSLIEKCLEKASAEQGDINVVYLRKRESGIRCSLNPPLDEIEADLLVEPLPAPADYKVEVWCEDDEAAWVLRNILPPKLNKKCHIVSAGLSCGELGELAIRNIPALTYVLFCVDADSNKGASKKVRDCNKRFVLPGGDSSPEESIYQMLVGLSDDHEFWGKYRGYTKQLMTKRHEEGEREFDSRGGKKVRVYNKEWLKKEKAEGFWGANGADVIKLWKDQHAVEIDAFCEQFGKRVDGVIRRHSYETKGE